MIEHGQKEEGERLLLNAIAELEKLGADVDEATARSDLCSYLYLPNSQFDKAAAHLTRSVDLANRAGHALQLGRASNNLGISRLAEAQFSEATDHFHRAVQNFQLVDDLVGEGEATNNLGRLFLETEQYDAAYECFDRAVRLYRRSGARSRALEKALLVADQFAALNQPARTKHFLDIAQFLGADGMDQGVLGRLLLGLGRYHLDTDLKTAEQELKAAHEIFVSVGDETRVHETSRLLEFASNRRVSQRIRYTLFVLAGILLAAWLLLSRRAVGTYLVEVWMAVYEAVSFIARCYKRVRDWWAGPEPDLGRDETLAMRGLEVQQRRCFWSFVVVSLLMVFTFDALMIVLPHLGAVSESKATVTKWPMPPGVREQFQSLLNRTAVYVGVQFLIRALSLVFTLCGSLLTYSAVEHLVFHGLNRVSRPCERDLDADFRVRMLHATRSQLRWASPILVVVIIAAGILYYCVGGISRATIHYMGIGCLVGIAAWEITRFRGAYHNVQALHHAQRSEAFEWLHRASRHTVISLFLNFVMYACVVVPAFYIGTRAFQRWLVSASLERNLHEFNHLILESVNKYGLIMMEGNSALIFSRLNEAYNPQGGAEQIWTEFLWPILPYCFVVWAIVMFTRLWLPWIYTFGNRRRFVSFIWIGVIISILESIFGAVAIYVFHLDQNLLGSSLVLFGVCLMVTLYLEEAIRSEARPDVICNSMDCLHRNPAEAVYCNKCGTKL